MPFDSDTEEFLKAVPRSRSTYEPGLNWFQEFLLSLPEYQGVQAPLKVFLDRVAEDQDLPKRERKRVDRNALRGFVPFLQEREKSTKTINTYMTAVQSLGSYFEISLTTKFLNVPRPRVQTKSHPWKPEEIANFIALLKGPLHQCTCATFYQSGLGISDTLLLTYGDIQKEYEAGIVPLCFDLARYKTGVEHRTFISTEAVELLHRHFKTNGVPKPDEHLFQITDRAIQGIFARRAKKLLKSWDYRNPMSPHSIRKGFRKMVVNAGCPESYAEYWMGHNLESDLRKTYTAMSTDEWRAEYSKYMTALSFKLPLS